MRLHSASSVSVTHPVGWKLPLSSPGGVGDAAGAPGLASPCGAGCLQSPGPQAAPRSCPPHLRSFFPVLFTCSRLTHLRGFPLQAHLPQHKPSCAAVPLPCRTGPSPRPCVALAVLPAEGPLGPWPAPATPPDPASPRTQPGPEFVLLKLLKETVSSLGACARVPPSAVTAAPQPRGAPCLLSVNPLGL